ncbi:MAG TPA: PAS domain S-box protein [Gemmatimonadales bacterium]|nr:PAS domain S-box protein [Gemmatimonadales bacterium]
MTTAKGPALAPPAPAGTAPVREAAAELEALLAAMSDVILVLDATGRYVKIAPTNPSLLYRPAPELLGRTLHDVFDRQQADEFLAVVRRALERRETVHTEYSLPIGGREVWFSAAVSPMGADRVVWVGRDVTEQRRTAEALQASEQRFRQLVEHSSDVITLLGRDGTVLYASQSSQPVLGYGPTENVGRSAFELIHPDDRPAALELFGEVMQRPGHHVKTELRALHQDGTWRLLEAHGVNRLDDPAIGAIVVTYRDITERHRIEQNLHETLSLLSATFDSTADGILVVDLAGHILSFNRKFAELWRIPDSILEAKDSAQALAFVLEQLPDPEGFLAKIRGLYARPDASSFDVLTFKDGRIYERLSQPQRIAGKSVGRVWSFRDVTESRRAEQVQLATYRISEAAHAARNLRELYAAIHQIVGELMPAKNFYIALYDPGTELLTFPYFVDEVDTDFPAKRLGKGLTEYVLRTGQPLLVTPEVHAELERRGEVELIGAPSIDWVGVPLKIGDRTIGVLVAQTYTPGVRYGEKEKHILQFVSTQVAMAIERKRTEEQLHDSERKYRLLFETNPEPMFVYDFETLQILAVNEAAIKRYGYSEPEFLGLTIGDIRPPEDQAGLEEELGHRPPEGAVRVGVRHRTKEGRPFEVDLVARPLEFAGRRARLVLARDVTAQRHLEEQLRQSQKMEAVGQLAGGIAHDFNNLLTAILGSTQLLLHATPPGDTRREDIEEIRNAGLRAAELTRQLLAFSRRQVLAPKVLELNAVVANMERMLRRLLGEDVELATTLDPDTGAVSADPGQLEQVLLNLAVNARDAMPHGGRLSVNTARFTLGEEHIERRHRLPPGDYACLAVTDTGVGMDEATQAHLFEPFFTTKEVGKGTGLGLATVYGIVKQSGGYIWVYSEPGQGTTFTVYLPRLPGTGRPESVAPAEPATLPGTETILLAEDEATVRTVVRDALQRLGYTVLEAASAEAAIEIADRHEGPIHLLLTDVVMPEQSGDRLAVRLRRARPEMRVLLVSGYPDDRVVRCTEQGQSVSYLQKPFGLETLARTVRQALGH